MKKLSCFLAVLYLIVLTFPLAFAQQESDSPYDMINGRHQDFTEFEELASGPMPWIRDETLVPDYYAIYLEQAKRFESFLARYPKSPLKPEALLRIAMLYLDVEGPDVHAFRRKLFFCQGVALQRQNDQDFYRCEQEFNLNVASSGKIDLVYERLGRSILEELAERYPDAKRYIKDSGGFRFDDEEIAAISLYVLAKIAIPQDKEAYYKSILEYKIRPELRRDIQNRLIQ